MAKRRKVALIYKYREDWIGGTYYIHNLIRALNLIEDEKKPLLLVISDEHDFKELQKELEYPYLSNVPFDYQYNIIQRAANKVSRKVLGHKIFDKERAIADISFPVLSERQFSYGKRKLFWIADFQDYHLPLFFSQEEIDVRKTFRDFVVNKGKTIVFSSESAKKDFNEIYPHNQLKQFVLPFAVIHPETLHVKLEEVVAKYKIPDQYFICSNQFWKHKNHHVILRAINYLKNRGIVVHVVFTGKETDYRDPLYFGTFKSMAESLGINNNISILGFISRQDQLSLIRNAIAVIQPSLFEGWSTVIEDAKAIGVQIITSEIPVHKEQLQQYQMKEFFSPNDEIELAECMTNLIENKSERAYHFYDYEKDVFQFGRTFISILDLVEAN
jgi:glycosyltransferase involved in cell wall biosynthesis